MSSNGNGPDDLEDKLERLVDAQIQTNQQIEGLNNRLDTLFESIQRGVEEETGEDIQGQEKADLWDVGQRSPGKARNADDYIRLRRKTAWMNDISVPQVHIDAGNLVDFFLEVYRMYGEHLTRINYALSKSDWKEFIQRLAVIYGAEQELIDILNPSPGVFGVDVIDGNVSVYESATHMSFTDAYGNYWFAVETGVGFKTYSSPSNSLFLPELDETSAVVGLLQSREIDAKLAEAITDRGDLTLPDKYLPLLQR